MGVKTGLLPSTPYFKFRIFDFGNSVKKIMQKIISLINAKNMKLAMHQDKYNLTWHSYSAHLRSMMKELMLNEDFSDVTLVTEDKKQIKVWTQTISP